MERMDPKYERKMEDFRRRVLEQPGTLDPVIRRAAASGAELPDPLAAYADSVRRHAYKVTDADVANLLAAGHSEDQIFELTVAAAYGAARQRLDAAMSAMASSSDTAAEAER